MLTKAALAGAIAGSWSPAVCDELRSYTVTVIEQIRHEITVAATQEYAARTDAVLEARRVSGSGRPWWKPSAPNVLAHSRRAGDFGVIDVELLSVTATPESRPKPTPLEMFAAP
jgi:hypothetical protein